METNVRHRLSAVFLLVTLLLLGRGALVFANAHARWNPAFNDPARADVCDIAGFITETALYSDPMDDVRRALLVVLRPSGRIAPASALAIDEAFPGAHRPRAPPTA